jgi:hypothetical protein
MGDDPTSLREKWKAAWPKALAAWSRFVQLSEPHWCFDALEEKSEQLLGSFAMIRLVDHAVVISLRQVREHKLDDFAVEVLAHEIGHHVYCPADLSDNARLLARIRAGLPTKEHLAPIVSNLYTDLLINDRLQRGGLDIAGVYERLAVPSKDRMWSLYMRIYEVLWNLPRGSFAVGDVDRRLDGDATLGARLIRSYAKDWLDGGGRFACLCLPYIIEDDGKSIGKSAGRWHDTRNAGRGGLPDGLAELDDVESAGAIHPSEDPDLSGLDADASDKASDADKPGGEEKGTGGHKTLKRYREPFEYAEVMKAAGANVPEADLIARYYRERALPHLVRFPVRENPTASDPHPEGLEGWDIGSALEDVDWLGTILASPNVIPGVTTRQRLYGTGAGTTPESTPIDLYLGVDCSGSMGNPAAGLSYPVLAGAIIALSALRTGSKVMVALSGEPGKTITTDGFVRDERAVLRTLTDYLGTGTTFGIHRLAETVTARPATARPVHILIVTDNDIFSMLDQGRGTEQGWAIAKQSLLAARGGGTYVLQLPRYLMEREGAREQVHPGCECMKRDGWNVANVDSMEELVEFARQFSRAAYGVAAPRSAAAATGKGAT